MKLQITGLEASSGMSGKSGKAYEIGQLHSLAALASPFGEGNIAQGYMGTTYRCPIAIVKSVAHLPVPFWAEVEVVDVMKFGKREQEVQGIKPIALAKT